MGTEKSLKIYTPCFCPKCRNDYTRLEYYTGKFPYRKFCDSCKIKVDRIDGETFRVLTDDSNARSQAQMAK